MRTGNIEGRWSKFNEKHELIEWISDDQCMVIAFFDEHKEGGYDMRTVGDRFFNEEDAFVIGKHYMAFITEIRERDANEES